MEIKIFMKHYRMNRHLWFCFLSLYAALILCCTTARKTPSKNEGVLEMVTNFYDNRGKPTFTAKSKIWYSDYAAIQEINMLKILTDTDNVSHFTHEVMFYKFTNLNNEVASYYKSFSDTSTSFSRNTLQKDSLKAQSWNFYKDTVYKIKGVPFELGDTVIDRVSYKVIRFEVLNEHPAKKTYAIGYLRYNTGSNLFSLEKGYSWKNGYSLEKVLEFQEGSKIPFASMEINHLRDSLNLEELKVFDAWKKNTESYPVKK